jgi:hypothetical protein
MVATDDEDDPDILALLSGPDGDGVGINVGGGKRVSVEREVGKGMEADGRMDPVGIRGGAVTPKDGVGRIGGGAVRVDGSMDELVGCGSKEVSGMVMVGSV